LNLLVVAAATFGWEARSTPLLVSSPPAAATPLPNRLRLVSWNVHKKTDSVFLAELRELLDSTSADLVLVQEFAPRDRAGGDAALANRPWALSANLRTGSPPVETGVATSARSLARAHALLSEGAEPLVGSRKAALASWHPSAQDTLLVVNLHALNFLPGLDGFRQQLGTISRMAAQHQGPAVVAGDFNTWSAARLRTADSLLGAAGLVRLDFGADESRKRRAFGHGLDQVYFTPRLLRPVRSECGIPTRFRSSDHTPLIATFERIP